MNIVLLFLSIGYWTSDIDLSNIFTFQVRTCKILMDNIIVNGRIPIQETRPLI